MTDLERMYASMVEEADRVRLPGPEGVRGRADRRTRTRLALASTAAAVLVAGTIIGSQAVFKANPAPLPQPPVTSGRPETPTARPTTAPSSPASPSPAQSDPTPTATAPSQSESSALRVPTSIPDSAFLQLADINGDAPPANRPDGEDMLPPLCGTTYASDDQVQVRRTKHIIYWKEPAPGNVPDGTFYQTITAYRSDGAERFMRQLRDAVTACPTQTLDGVTYRQRLLSGPTYGDQSLLFEVRYPTLGGDGAPTGGEDVRLVSVVRVGTVVMVLNEQGWEAGWSAEGPVVDEFTRTALSRLRSWLD